MFLKEESSCARRFFIGAAFTLLLVIGVTLGVLFSLTTYLYCERMMMMKEWIV
jgi:hypothetical protein